MGISSWFSGMQDVALLAAVSVVGLLVVARYLSRERISVTKLAQLHRNQQGGAYTLNFVLALFCLFSFICVIVECGQLFLAKTGTVYSAFAAARTAIVHADRAKRERAAEQAAVQSFVPFSRGLTKYDPAEFENDGESQLWQAYREVANQPVNQKYFRNKEATAARRIELSINDLDPDDPNGSLEVAVSYRYPLMFPFFGSVLGSREGAEYYRLMKSVVTLPKELPQSQNQKLGIEYDGN